MAFLVKMALRPIGPLEKCSDKRRYHLICATPPVGELVEFFECADH